MDIIEAIHSERIFKPLFDDLESWKSWEVCLKSIFGLPMDRKEWKVYKKHTNRTDRPEKQFPECFLIVGRRGGKSFISALTAVFLATFREWNLGIERGHIICVASDRRQAGVTFGYIKQILQLPIFRSMVVTERAEEIELSNQMTISVHTCSFRSLRGYSICACVCDELAFWRVEGSNPSREILTALRPSLGNIPGSLLLAISTGYSRTGPLWESYRDKFGKNDPQCLVWKAGTQDMNPRYSHSVIQRALKNDFQAAQSEYFGEFRDDLQDFIPDAVLSSSIEKGRLELPPVPSMRLAGFCDLSGGVKDNMALSICGLEENGQIVQCAIRVVKSPCDPSKAVKLFSDTLKMYGLYSVTGDKYSAQWCVSAFQKEGIMYEHSPLDKSALYLNFLPHLMQGRVRLLDHTGQTTELRQLERRAGRLRDVVDHPPGLKDDIANSCAGGVVMLSTDEGGRVPPPSLGLVEKSVKESMDQEAVKWLLGGEREKSPEQVEIDEIEKEMMEIDEEIRKEMAEERRGKSGVKFSRWK